MNGSTREFERVLGERDHETYVLRLYVTGMSARSTEAVAAMRQICDEHLPGRYDLAVVDLYQDPARAREQQIIAAPTLIKEHPLPVRRLIGNLSDRERVLRGLNLIPLPE